MNTPRLNSKRYLILIAGICVLLVAPAGAAFADEAAAAATDTAASGMPWWGWSVLLFGFAIVLGVVAVIGGVGGGVMYVPIVSAIFPMHLDFVRGAGLMVALCGALSASPHLLRSRLANIRLAMPAALVGSAGSIVGALVGLALPTRTVQSMLGAAILGIAVLMLLARRSEFPLVRQRDRLAELLDLGGTLKDAHTGEERAWTVHRTPIALVTFLIIGVLGGMFGLGAGWANVPALNLLLGAPLKISVATSGFILALNGTAAVWVYIAKGAILPIVVAPSVAGMMIGTRIGARILPRIHAKVVRWVVILILVVAGVRSLLAGILGG